MPTLMESIEIDSFLPFLTVVKNLRANSIRHIVSRAKLINTLSPLSQEKFEGFLMDKKAEGRAESTLFTYIFCWNNWVEFLDYRKIEHNFRKIPIHRQEQRKVLPILSEDEAEKLINIDLTYQMRNGWNSEQINRVYKTANQLIYLCGLRFHEMRELQVKSVDLENATIQLETTKSTPRTLFLTKGLVDALSELVDNKKLTDYVFTNSAGSQLGQDVFNDDQKRRAKEAGITKHVHPHMLRRTFASHLKLFGKQDVTEIARALGDKELQTVFDHYLWPYEGAQRSSIDTLPARAKELDPRDFIDMCIKEFEKRLQQNKQIFYHLSKMGTGFQLTVSKK